MTERVYGSHLPKECCQFVYGDCNGTIDMHFILLVYKYEYIMNKNSYFVDLLILCGIFQYDRTHGDTSFLNVSINSISIL